MEIKSYSSKGTAYIIGIFIVTGLAMWITKNPKWIWFALLAIFGL